MIRAFQIWTKNFNWIAFHPFLAKQLTELGKIPDLANFWQFLANEGVKCYSIWVLTLVLKSSRHFAPLRTPFDTIFTFWFFDLPCYFLPEMRPGISFIEKMKISKSSSWSALKCTRWRRPCVFKKSCANWATLQASPLWIADGNVKIQMIIVRKLIDIKIWLKHQNAANQQHFFLSD